MTDAFGIVANVISDKVLRTRAKVWIVYVRWPCAQVVGLSRGGRWLEKYIHLKRLETFRAKWIPEHLRYSHANHQGVILEWATKDEAQRVADDFVEYWRGVRFFKRDGTLIRDGITEGQARARALAKRREVR